MKDEASDSDGEDVPAWRDTTPSTSACVSFVFPRGNEDRIVPKLPSLVQVVGDENCYNVEGANLTEIKRKEKDARLRGSMLRRKMAAVSLE